MYLCSVYFHLLSGFYRFLFLFIFWLIFSPVFSFHLYSFSPPFSCYSSSAHSLLSRASECVLDLQALRRAQQSPRRCSVSGMRHWPLTRLSAACEGWQEPPGCSAPRGLQQDERGGSGGGGGRQAAIVHTCVGVGSLRAEQGISFEVWICLVSAVFLDSSRTFAAVVVVVRDELISRSFIIIRW